MKFIKNHLFLFSLIIILIMDTILEDVSNGHLISMIFVTVSSVLCLYVISGRKKIFTFLLIFSVLIVGFVDGTAFIKDHTLEAAKYFALAILFGTYALILFYLLISAEKLSFQDVSNAVSVYLLIGIFFGFVYGFIEVIQPGSFVYEKAGDGDISGDMVYFSFITLTSLGFGDILPINKYAKILVVFEVVTGVIYIAVMIGRLVGIGPALKKEKSDP
jgi:voltage-gated potassium channel